MGFIEKYGLRVFSNIFRILLIKFCEKVFNRPILNIIFINIDTSMIEKI